MNQTAVICVPPPLRPVERRQQDKRRWRHTQKQLKRYSKKYWWNLASPAIRNNAGKEGAYVMTPVIETSWRQSFARDFPGNWFVGGHRSASYIIPLRGAAVRSHPNRWPAMRGNALGPGWRGLTSRKFCCREEPPILRKQKCQGRQRTNNEILC